MSIKTFFNKLFSEDPDPLDDLLIEKGVDPKQLLRDVKMKRQEEGEDSGVNRALVRCNEKKRVARETIRKNMNS
jgi:hypothetical protein